jgi:MFS family permease
MKRCGKNRDSPAPHLALANTILREAREELARADGKASILLAAIGVIIGAIVAAILGGSWHPTHLDDNIEWLWWIGTAIGLAGAVAFGAAVFPRTTYRAKRRPGIVSYFGDVVGLSKVQLKEGLITTAKDPDAATLDQVEAISSVVDKKYRCIQVGMICVGAAALFWLFAVLIGG